MGLSPCPDEAAIGQKNPYRVLPFTFGILHGIRIFNPKLAMGLT
jgi:hypothetical protein